MESHDVSGKMRSIQPSRETLRTNQDFNLGEPLFTSAQNKIEQRKFIPEMDPELKQEL